MKRPLRTSITFFLFWSSAFPKSKTTTCRQLPYSHPFCKICSDLCGVYAKKTASLWVVRSSLSWKSVGRTSRLNLFLLSLKDWSACLAKFERSIPCLPVGSVVPCCLRNCSKARRIFTSSAFFGDSDQRKFISRSCSSSCHRRPNERNVLGPSEPFCKLGRTRPSCMPVVPHKAVAEVSE